MSTTPDEAAAETPEPTDEAPVESIAPELPPYRTDEEIIAEISQIEAELRRLPQYQQQLQHQLTANRAIMMERYQRQEMERSAATPPNRAARRGASKTTTKRAPARRGAAKK